MFVVIKNENMELLTDIAKITLPSILVIAMAYYMLKTLLEDHRKQRNFEYKLNTQKLITPLKLQAMERVILLLERITVDSLVRRLLTPKMTAARLGQDMVQAINSEYEHNLSQQLYLSGETWVIIKNAKDHTIKFINMVSQQVDPKGPASDLAKVLLEAVAESGETPSSMAINFVREELKKIA